MPASGRLSSRCGFATGSPSRITARHPRAIYSILTLLGAVNKPAADELAATIIGGRCSLMTY